MKVGISNARRVNLNLSIAFKVFKANHAVKAKLKLIWVHHLEQQNISSTLL